MLETAPQHSHHRTKILESTLRAITQALQLGVFAEELSQRTGFFQAIDPRVKVIVVLELLISVSLSRNAWGIASVYLLALGLAWLSAIDPIVLIRRVWIVMPFFTVPIALPALFLTPGPPGLVLPFGLTITQSGAAAVLFLMLRVSASITCTLLLIYTTAWNTVLGALTSLRLPVVFALILGMTYRYIYLFLRIANDMFLSRQSRIVGQLSTIDAQHVVAAASAALLEKSLKLSEDVYLAMQSRGFRGSMVSARRFQMHGPDWSALGAFSLITAACIWFGR